MNNKTFFVVEYSSWADQHAVAHVEVRSGIGYAPGEVTYYAMHPTLGCGKDAPTAEAAARRLVADHGSVIACYPLGDRSRIDPQVDAAYQRAMKDARRRCGKGGVLRSRGRYVVVTSAATGEPLVAFGEWLWTGARKQIAEIANYANDPRVDGIFIEGGVDYADSVRDFADCCYDPWVAEWSVTLFSRTVYCINGKA